MILFVQGLAFKSYLENPEPIRQETRPCPGCSLLLARHGSYRRRVRFAGGEERGRIFRLRCRPCRLTVTLLPDFLRPRQLYLVDVQEEATEAYLTAPYSYRGVAVDVAGAAIPSEVSVTDALLHEVRTKPSFQRTFDWVRELAAQSERLCQAILSGTLCLEPDHDVLHQVATEVDSIGAKGRSKEKRNQLRHAALLIGIVHAISVLGSGDRGWLRALYAFVRRVLGRIPGPGPPLPHTAGRVVLPAGP